MEEFVKCSDLPAWQCSSSRLNAFIEKANKTILNAEHLEKFSFAEADKNNQLNGSELLQAKLKAIESGWLLNVAYGESFGHEVIMYSFTKNNP